MKKAILIVLSVIFLLVGARATALAEKKESQPNDIKIYFQNMNSNYATFNVVDSATGVQYVAVSVTTSTNGGWGEAIAICPRYNANGTLYTGN